MKQVVRVQDIIGIWIFEGLSKGRLGDIYAILTVPDRDSFFIKIVNQQLSREAELIFSCELGNDL